MIKKIIILGCLAGASFFVACKQPAEKAQELTKEETTKSNVWIPETSEDSELALLMRDMFDKNMVIKGKLQSDDYPETYPEDFSNMHTAEATDPDEINEVYHSFVDMYLGMIKQYNETPDKEGKIIAFNNSVKACISCHQEYCQGPIPKIKKLYIKVEEGV